MKFCPDCGKPCEGLKFCGECGFDLRPYIPVVDNIKPPEAPKPQTTATAAVGTAQPAQPAKPQMVTAQAQEQTIPDNIETLLAPFEWKLNDDGKTFTITGVKDKNIQSADIPYGVTVIGEKAFYECRCLRSINIPNSVISIERFAFLNCFFESINIPDSVTSIGQRAFYYCTSLKHINIPDSVSSIGDGAFSTCTQVHLLGNNPFYRIENHCLIEIQTKTLKWGCAESIIPTDGSVTTIGEFAFDSCQSLASINIPDRVTSIGAWAFEYCRSLTSITIPSSIKSIDAGAFNFCSSLTSITIPDSVTSIGEYAFWSCSSLTSINIPNNVTSIGERAFYHCDSLTSITIPSSVTSIGTWAFGDCKSLKTAYVPKHTQIGEEAFPETCQIIRT